MNKGFKKHMSLGLYEMAKYLISMEYMKILDNTETKY